MGRILNGLVQTLRNLGLLRLASIGGVGIATVGFFIFLTSRLGAPGMALLYGDLDSRDSSQIVQKLDGAGIPYQLRGDSQIMVATDQVGKVRMMMAEAGLPRGGSIGYEIFDKSDALGTSSFVQNINQVRAIEGELSRTISSIGLVTGARVHVVLPQRELFSREKQEPSASIVLKMRGSQRLGKNQVAAIQHLVASAVPGLRPSRISIVDTDGTLLARGDGDTNSQFAASNADEMRVNYETRLSRSVEDMIERTVGVGKARVDVHVDMDFDRVTTNSESYDPNGQVVRSTQSVSDSSDNGQGTADQSVSVATNLPNAATGGANGAARNKTARTEETTNFDISKTVRTQVSEGGSIRKLSVAVLVDGSYTTGADGSKAYAPRPPEEMQQLATLVRSAIGFDANRGDSVEVVNLRFTTPDEPVGTAASSGFFGFEKSDLLRMGETLVFAIVGVLVILLVVRPLLARAFEVGSAAGTGGGNQDLQALIQTQMAGATAALPAPGGMGGMQGNAAIATPGGAPTPTMAFAAPRGQAGMEQMIDIGQVDGRVAASSIRKIGEIVDKHPEEAVSTVRSWMYQGG